MAVVLQFTPLPYRACELCTHGLGPAAQRQCRCPAVAGRAQAVPVDDARRTGGACGPDAAHLDFPGLKG